MSEHAYAQVVGLEEIDAAIIDWFDLTVDSHVEDPSGARVKVPVKLATGERWITSRERKGVRDDSGKIILPIITIRRTDINPDLTMQALGIETPTLQVAKRLSKKTNNLQNLNAAADVALRSPINPVVYEVTTIPFPDRKVLSYEVQIQTQYQVQMNAILEKLFSSIELQNSFVAPLDNDKRQPPKGEPFETRKSLNRAYVVGFWDSASTDAGNLEEFTDQERIIRYTSSFKVPATLQLDPEGTQPAVKVEKTAFGLNFGGETVHLVDDPYELELIFGNGKIREK